MELAGEIDKSHCHGEKSKEVGIGLRLENGMRNEEDSKGK
jgi:hypothetical protein